MSQINVGRLSQDKEIATFWRMAYVSEDQRERERSHAYALGYYDASLGRGTSWREKIDYYKNVEAYFMGHADGAGDYSGQV